MRTAITFGFVVGSAIAAYPRGSDLNDLQGRWRVIALAGEMAMPLHGIIGHGTITIVGDTMAMLGVGNADDAHDRFMFTLDTVPSPRHIDLVEVASAVREPWLGTYRLATDTLRLALPIEHGDGRSFRPLADDGPNTLGLILLREKR